MECRLAAGLPPSRCAITSSHTSKVYDYRTIDQVLHGNAINTTMASRVNSASDLAFLNEPYHPIYSPFAAKPVLVHQ